MRRAFRAVPQSSPSYTRAIVFGHIGIERPLERRASGYARVSNEVRQEMHKRKARLPIRLSLCYHCPPRRLVQAKSPQRGHHTQNKASKSRGTYFKSRPMHPRSTATIASWSAMSTTQDQTHRTVWLCHLLLDLQCRQSSCLNPFLDCRACKKEIRKKLCVRNAANTRFETSGCKQSSASPQAHWRPRL